MTADLNPARWKLWTLSVPAMVFVLAADSVAGVYVVRLAGRLESATGLATGVAIVVSALIAVEGARRVESRRRRGTGALHKDLSPAWILAAAIVLHPALAVPVALVLRGWWRIRAGRCIPYRWVFSTAAVVLAIGAAHAVFASSSSVLGTGGTTRLAAMALAAATYVGVESVLCGVCILLIQPGSGYRDRGGPARLVARAGGGSAAPYR